MDISTTAIAVAQVPAVFLGIMPSAETMINTASESEALKVKFARDIAAAVSLSIGLLLSWVSRDSAPFIFAMIATAIMFYVVDHMNNAQIGTNHAG